MAAGPGRWGAAGDGGANVLGGHPQRVGRVARGAFGGEEKEEESLPSLPSIPEGEAEPEEKVRCTSGWAEWQEEEMEERLPGIPDEDDEPAKKVRCTSATCASQKVWYAGQWRGQWLGLCGCPFALKEVAGVMLMCAEEDGDRREE